MVLLGAILEESAATADHEKSEKENLREKEVKKSRISRSAWLSSSG